MSPTPADTVPDATEEHLVQACVRIKLYPRTSLGTVDAEATPAAAAASGSARRLSISEARSASIKTAVEAAASVGSTSDAVLPQLPYAVQVRLCGLDGLQQDLVSTTGSWEQCAASQPVQCYSAQLPDLQLLVTEQRVRSWVAAAAQLQVHATVLTAAQAAEAAPKKTPASAAKGAAAAAAAASAAAPPVATGSFTVNCAGLLLGDTHAIYQRGSLPAAAPAAQLHADTATAAAPVLAAGSGSQGGSMGSMAGTAAGPVVPQAPGWAACCKWSPQPPSGSLQDWLAAAEVSLQLFKPAPSADAPHSDAKAANKQQAPATAAATTKAAAAKPPAPGTGPAAPNTAGTAPAADTIPELLPQPCSLLSPQQAAALNPVVVYASKAACLPDAPATRQQLEELCGPVQLRCVWPPLPAPADQAAASVSAWSTLSNPAFSTSNQLSTRTATFASPFIILGCDVGQQQLMQLCRSSCLQLQVHDRAALPEPAPFTAGRMQRQQQLQLQQAQQQVATGKDGARTSTAKQTAVAKAASGKAAQGPPAAAAGANSSKANPGGSGGAAAAAAVAAGAGPSGSNRSSSSAPVLDTATAVITDGEVYGCVSLNLVELVRGKTCCCFKLPLRPVSTMRGGSSLDWKTRPGRYLEAEAMLKGWVRCAVPLHLMAAPGAAGTAAEPAAVLAGAGGRAATAAAVGAAGLAPAAANPAAAAAAPVRRTNSISVAAPKATPTGKPATVPSPPAAAAAGKAAMMSGAPSAAAAAGGTGGAGIPQEAQLPSASSTAGNTVQLAGAQQETLPQPKAHVMLPSQLRYPGHITRAVLMMDYRDSDLLHAVEDAVRQHNAIALGLAPPPPPSPEELAAARAAEAAAAAAAEAAAAAAAAAAAVGSQRAKSRPGSAAAGVKPGQKPAAAANSRAVATKLSATGAAPAAKAAGASASDAAAAAAAAAVPGVDPALASKAAARRSLAGASVQAGTPRSILKAGSSIAGLGPEPSTLTSGMASSRQEKQQQQQPLRASFTGELESCCGGGKGCSGKKRLGDDGASSSEEDDSDEELSEVDARLYAVLRKYEHVDLDQRLLQVLSTQQLSAEQAADAALDVITGFQLVDGELRLMVLEGPVAGGGMSTLVPALARWAIQDQEEADRHQQQQQQKAEERQGSRAASRGRREEPQEEQEQQQQWLPRRVLYNPSVRYPVRLYGSLGVDLWMLKLCDSLAVLAGRASTYAAHVRPECIAGMRCLLGITQGYLRPPVATGLSSSPAGTEEALPPQGNSQATTTTTGGAHDRAGQQQSGLQQPSAAVVMMRQLDTYQLFPSAEQLHLVDKKFGGELTKADVLGVEAEEEDDSSSDEELHEGHQGPNSRASYAQQGTAAACSTAGGSSGQQQARGPQELTGSHAAAAAAKAASLKLQALLADSHDMGATGSGTAAAAAQSLKSFKSRRSSRRSGCVAGSSRRSRSRSRRRGRHGGSSSGGKARRAFRPKHALDMDNSVYLHLRMEAHRRRVQRDIQADHLQVLSALSASTQPLREAWASWNPQRAAAKELQRRVEAGELTLQDTIKAYRDATSPRRAGSTLQHPADGTSDAAKQSGAAVHAQPWLWPAPRDPATYNTHPLKPSDFRVQELQEPWQEGQLAAAAAAEGGTSGRHAVPGGGSRPSFDAICRPAGRLFTQDPAFWQTVHLGGDDWHQTLQQQAAAAKAAWTSKVVVDDINFHRLPGTADKAAAQADRLSNLLKGEPVKAGFKLTHVQPPPVSMFVSLPWEPPAAPAAASKTLPSTVKATVDRTKWVADKDFDVLSNPKRSAVAKPGFSDATTAALHDKDKNPATAT